MFANGYRQQQPQDGNNYGLCYHIVPFRALYSPLLRSTCKPPNQGFHRCPPSRSLFGVARSDNSLIVGYNPDI